MARKTLFKIITVGKNIELASNYNTGDFQPTGRVREWVAN